MRMIYSVITWQVVWQFNVDSLGVDYVKLALVIDKSPKIDKISTQ